MSEFCVIGSGISGATIANLLNKKNSVILFDKARGPGGRASFKRMKGNIGFDHGTQYFSPKTPEFKKFTKDLIKKRILKVWGGKHIFLNSKKKENKKHLKIIGKNGNNDISKYLLKKINCNYQSELKKIHYKNKLWHLSFADGKLRSFKSIILTCPFPQLKKLSKRFINNSFLKKSIKMDANITTMIAIKKNKKSNSSYLFEDPILGWAGNENSKKRFKSKYDLWTLQSTFKWANKKINKNKNNKKENSKIMAEKVLTGKNVVYLTVGDPYLYSTWIYMHREISQKHPEIDITVIPGIVSMFTFASKVGVSIAEGAEKVSIIPSCYDLSSVKEIAKNSEVLVFLKDGRYFDQVIELVRESGFPDDSIFAIGQDLGTDKEIIRKLRLGDVNDDTLTTKYFSILVIKRV